MSKKLAPIHPGEVLLADFLEPYELSQVRPAHSLSVPPRRINKIVRGKRAITADTAPEDLFNGIDSRRARRACPPAL
jgi:addiction module HigA family antidote